MSLRYGGILSSMWIEVARNGQIAENHHKVDKEYRWYTCGDEDMCGSCGRIVNLHKYRMSYCNTCYIYTCRHCLPQDRGTCHNCLNED